MRIARPKTALLITSSAADVLRSGVNLNITGLDPLSTRNLLAARQYKARAEVVKVETVAYGSYVPTASTQYTISVTDPTSNTKSQSNATVPITFSYITPASLIAIGATTALQWEYITTQLLLKLNNYTSIVNIVGLTTGSGTGFTLTDTAGYFPPKTGGGQNPRQGATDIFLPYDQNDNGFIDANFRTITTYPVYQLGQGTRMQQDIAIIAANFGGNIVAGEYDCPMTIADPPTGPVSGQLYDLFAIDALIPSTIPTIGEVQGYRMASEWVWVDNGLGAATTNRAGFLTFERAMHKIIFGLYNTDPHTVIEFCDLPFIFQGPLAAVPIGASNEQDQMLTPYGGLELYNIGTNTAIPVPAQGANGLLTDSVLTATHGWEISPRVDAICDQQFTVGTDVASVIAKFQQTDITGGSILVGFRKKAAFNATYTSYTDFAVVGVYTAGTHYYSVANLASGGAYAFDTTKISVNSIAQEVRVNVDINGAVTAYVNNVLVPVYSASGVPMVFAAGTIIIPVYRNANVGGGTPVSLLTEFVAVADNYWKVDA